MEQKDVQKLFPNATESMRGDVLVLELRTPGEIQEVGEVAALLAQSAGGTLRLGPGDAQVTHGTRLRVTVNSWGDFELNGLSLGLVDLSDDSSTAFELYNQGLRDWALRVGEAVEVLYRQKKLEPLVPSPEPNGWWDSWGYAGLEFSVLFEDLAGSFRT